MTKLRIAKYLNFYFVKTAFSWAKSSFISNGPDLSMDDRMDMAIGKCKSRQT